ncbi:TSUP family transporter [Sphaerochaeta globosa]|uniref:Probable membrane transporter protein n=1 Tax=Sphaerochaeta globosa (strain ATCC BAA-1886 / DSM 22777 / Buddy) TaxID=158189 RepID=F0RYV8_SPHGB|nr:TSUP family transporter [Sphaerochaeta globosa]ADY13094.1 protein of unknown function DUF81 [Sphaerochaeta globosa str. Buddy]
MNILFLLCPIIAFGSFVDAIAGGGGLITLTAYVAVGLPPQTALGNNKFASASGTLVASIQYLRRSQVSLSIGLVATLFSFIGSAMGSALATRYADTYLNYLLVFLVPALALFMIFKPDFGQAQQKSRLFLYSLASITGLVIGCYDGFFGPGTGMFLTVIFTSVLGMDLLKACGTARIVNLASNVAALAMFLYHGVIDFSIAIPCAVSAVIGGYLGSRLALKVGANVVKPVMLFVLLLLLVKVAVSLF